MQELEKCPNVPIYYLNILLNTFESMNSNYIKYPFYLFSPSISVTLKFYFVTVKKICMTYFHILKEDDYICMYLKLSP